MSSDLLKEFVPPQESLRNKLPGQSIIKGITAEEEEDFGDFEDPESVESIIGRLDEGRPQTSLAEELADPADNDEDWGDFTDNADQSVFFDADQELKMQNGHTKRLQIKQQEAKKPLKVSLAPIPLAKAPSTPVSVQFEPESSVNISQDPIALRKAITPAATAEVEPKLSVIAANAVDLGPPPTNIPLRLSYCPSLQHSSNLCLQT